MQFLHQCLLHLYQFWKFARFRGFDFFKRKRRHFLVIFQTVLSPDIRNVIFFLENRKNKCDLKFDLKLQSFLPFFQRFLSGFLAIAINLSDMVKKCMRMKRSLHESWLNLDSWKAFLRQFWEWAWLLFYTLGQNPIFCLFYWFLQFFRYKSKSRF